MYAARLPPLRTALSAIRPGGARCLRSLAPGALALLACAVLVASGCERHTDWVAVRLQLTDAGVDAEAGMIDARVPDAAPPEAGPQPVGCAAVGCSALASRDALCATPPGTPAVRLGDGCDANGPPRFRFAVCTCTDLVSNGRLEVDALPGQPPGSASVSVNGDLSLSADTAIYGSLRIGGMFSPWVEAQPHVSGQLLERAEPACDCEPRRLLDVAALVAAHALDNDNARAGLAPNALDGYIDAQMLELECGRYYLSRVAGNQPLHIQARGRLALFIRGNLELGPAFTLALLNGASVEIYVSGNVRVSGRLELGTSNDGNRVLFAVGGTGNIQLDGPARIDGTIYAPHAEIVTQAGLELHGALFVERAQLSGETRVHYQPLAAPASDCTP